MRLPWMPTTSTAMWIVVLAVFCSAKITHAASSNWPQFRGPMASGIAENQIKEVPITWNIKSGQNVLWQTPIEGLSHSSPIIWNDYLYEVTVVRPGVTNTELKVGLYGSGDSFKEKDLHQWKLICIGKRNGKILWQKTAIETVPRLERHTKATHANSTPATDGKRIVALLGSEGLYCFDMDGKELWHKDLGKMDAGPYDAPTLQWGFASSPVLFDNKVIVQCDTLSEQFLAVFDANDGKEIWRTPRKDVATWSTPAIAPLPNAGATQIVVNGWKQIAGYDLRTGHQLWSLKEGGDIPVASPVVFGNIAYLTSGHGKYRPMRAVNLSIAKGDISPAEIDGTSEAVMWSHARQGNYVQTPIVIGKYVWGCLDSGILTCFDAKSGKIQYSERIGNGSQGFTSSPVSANGRIYLASELGDVYVIAATNKLTFVATNQLGDMCLSTPAISDGALYYRTRDKVIAFGR